jgi:HEAT repeat protein
MWAVNRLTQGRKSSIKSTELLAMAERWLPEFFEGYVIDAERLQAYRRVKTIQVEAAIAGDAPKHEAKALECLESPKVERRVRGLSLLAEIRDPDLFEWCMMCLEDDSVNVRIAALRTMQLCDAIQPEAVVALADSENKRIRGAAIAVLSKHSTEDKVKWFRQGLTDPCPCVRVEVARLLPNLDPKTDRAVFQIALHDPNPDIVRRAEKLTQGKGYSKWRAAQRTEVR